ncbi:MAG: polysaccharide deacetylase family protein [Anaerolineae bacterium]|nr:polysaccharide deacetylase family protein [Anaerolineae bacterium]
MSALPSTPWPARCRGAISLTFDDGRPSQLRRAVPILAEYGLPATFYLNPRGENWRADLAPWRNVAAAGHEIGNHTMAHPCTRTVLPNCRPCLEELTLAELEADIVEASRRLREAIPAQADFTFAYPCYQEHVGVGATRQSYVPLIARHFIAGRGRGEFGHNDPATCDLAYLFSWNVEHLTGPTLVGLAEQAIELGRWTIFTIHGIEDGNLPLAEVALRELCRYLVRRRDEIWTAPVIAVAQRIAAWREANRTPEDRSTS